MAKPRVFLSSTCYDLNDARAALTQFLGEYGFEVLNSQLGSFGVRPKVHSHQACLDEVRNADYLILIIGGRRGGTFIGSERSITSEEVKLAQKLSIPIIAFVDRNVDQQRITYKKNPRADFTHIVDDVRIFDFIDWVSSGHEDNWLHPFGSVSDIVSTLRHQFAHYLHLYSRSLRPVDRSDRIETRRLVPMPFPSNLEGVEDIATDHDEAVQLKADLRIVYDAITSLLQADTKEGAKLEQLKAIWVIGRHGRPNERSVVLKEDRFKGSAWGITRGKRVFNQMDGTGISGEYDSEEDNEGRPYGVVSVTFTKDTDAAPGYALNRWIKALVERYGEDEALDYFQRADMRLFSRQERQRTGDGHRPVVGTPPAQSVRRKNLPRLPRRDSQA